MSTAKQPKAPRPPRKHKNQENHEKHENTSKKQEIIIWMQGMQDITVHGEAAQGAQAAPYTKIMKTKKSMKTQAKSRK